MGAEQPAGAAHALPEATQRAFARLRANFLSSLEGRVREILDAKDDPARSAALHRLVGAAGSFGFAEISTAARAAEALSAQAPGEAYREAWAALQAHIARACADPACGEIAGQRLG